MKKYYKNSPDGTRDMIFEQADVKISLVEEIRKNFASRGYSEILTPSIEFYDLFTAQTNTIDPELMYKLSDNKGRLIVFRPDSTAPIARAISARISDKKQIVKLHYTQSVLRQENELSGRPCEIMQSGVEIVGASSLRSDIEVINAAVSSLKLSGADFKLEIGHVGYFNALVKNIPFSEYDTEKLLKCLEYKNHSALLDLLSDYSGYPETKAIAALPYLFGGREILDDAKAITENKEALGCLEYLSELLDGLREIGIDKYISLDVGIASSLEYYTGIVFQAYVDRIGVPVLSGGRYDNLYAAFGSDRPAVGFAINIDALASIRNAEENKKNTQVLISYKKGFAKEAYEYLEEQIEKGITAEIDLYSDTEETKKYAEFRGIEKIKYFGEEK